MRIIVMAVQQQSPQARKSNSSLTLAGRCLLRRPIRREETLATVGLVRDGRVNRRHVAN